jgi:ankyrin repeat protein
MVGDMDIVKWLLDHGADVNAQGYLCWAPLHSAANYGHLQVFRMLIEHKADIHIRTNNGKYPLHVAASPRVKRDHVDIMKILLDRGADPNARDKGSSTPLHYSSWLRKGISSRRQGTVEGTRLLLEYGAIVDVKDNEGRTPLKLAMEHGCHAIEACLKEHGAIVD